jgi:hypothetical protein
MVETGFARLGRRGRRTARGVPAFQHLEYPRSHRLHAERDPGEAGLTQALERGRRDRLRVGLGGDLGIGGQAPGAVDRLQDAGEIVGVEQRGRTPADEHRVHPRG